MSVSIYCMQRENEFISLLIILLLKITTKINKDNKLENKKNIKIYLLSNFYLLTITIRRLKWPCLLWNFTLILNIVM